MYRGKRILSVIMARGGSKGIKNKNLKKIDKLSLVARAAKIMSKIKIIDKNIISSDSYNIISEAVKFGAKKLFVRPKKLSGDIVSDYAVIRHSLLKAEEKENLKYDIVLMIQPTSPLRKKKHIFDCIKLFFKFKNTTSVWAVSKVDTKFHPLKILNIKNNYLKYHDPKAKKIIARQQLDSKYFRNGICYAIARKTILDDKNLIGKKCVPYIIRDPLVNIDTKEDLKLAESLIKKASTQ